MQGFSKKIQILPIDSISEMGCCVTAFRRPHGFGAQAAPQHENPGRSLPPIMRTGMRSSAQKARYTFFCRTNSPTAQFWIFRLRAPITRRRKDSSPRCGVNPACDDQLRSLAGKSIRSRDFFLLPPLDFPKIDLNVTLKATEVDPITICNSVCVKETVSLRIARTPQCCLVHPWENVAAGTSVPVCIYVRRVAFNSSWRKSCKRLSSYLICPFSMSQL